MYWGQHRTEKTEHEKALEWELEELRDRESRRQEEEHRQRQERQREREEQANYYWREADNWPDALQKQIYLCRREVGLIGDDTPPEEDFFEQSAQACESALEFWKEVEADNQFEIDKLEAQIQSIRDSIRETVADRLDAIKQNSGYSSVAQQIRDNDLNNFLNW